MRCPRGRTVALLSLIAGFAVLAIAGVTLEDRIVEWWYRHERIPVVRTWKQLLRQKPIDLGDGVKVRLGIEARSCPAESGVLIYCLTENYDPSRGTITTPNRLGPVRVSVEWDGQAARLRQEAHIMRRVRSPRDSKMLWFATVIPVDRVGRARISAESLQGESLRHVTVEGTPASFHSWRTIGETKHRLRKLRRLKPGEERVSEAYVSVVGGPRALPRWDGIEPFVFHVEGDGIPNPLSGRLPSLFPDKPDPDFRLEESDKNVLTLSSDEEFLIYRSHWHFLARWWVNGQPSTLDKSLRGRGFFRTTGPQLLRVKGKKLRLHLDFDPKLIGAQPGDRTEVQLLYCPQTWSYEDPTLEMFSVVDDVDETQVRMTNRVEFATED